MKTQFQSVQELASELHRRNANKRDFVADTSQVMLTQTNAGLGLTLGTSAVFNTNQHFHRQLGQHVSVPAPMYDRLSGNHPDLLVHLVNGLLSRERSRRMVRTLDGTARAFLSDRYRPLDNSELAEAVFPILGRAEEMQIVSSAFTETKFYLKAVFPRREAEVKRGDAVQAGIVISNSEVGNGSLSVSPMLYRLVCLNGLISAEYGSRTYHVGKQAQTIDGAFEVFRDETRRADDKALWLKVQDIVSAAMNDVQFFEGQVQRLRDATEQRIEGNPVKAIEEVSSKFGYGEKVQGSILQHLIEGGDLSRYGVVQAITRAAHDVEDYDVATQMERDGGRLIELPPSEWQVLAQAA